MVKQTSVRPRLARRLGIVWAIALRRSPAVPAEAPAREDVVVGPRDRWQPLVSSEEVPPGSVRALRVFGEDVVLWRGMGGTPGLVGDLCPHRDTPLSTGDVVEEDLRCREHGWQFDCLGACTAIPSKRGASALQAKTRVQVVHPVREAAGTMWGWFGAGEPPDLDVDVLARVQR